jgi:hypothetical protein
MRGLALDKSAGLDVAWTVSDQTLASLTTDQDNAAGPAPPGGLAPSKTAKTGAAAVRIAPAKAGPARPTGL